MINVSFVGSGGMAAHYVDVYRSLEYVAVGVIPRYARGSTTPALEPATFMYKELEAGTVGT